MRTSAQKQTTHRKSEPSSAAWSNLRRSELYRREHPAVHPQRAICSKSMPLERAGAEEPALGLTNVASHRPGYDFSRIDIHPPVAGMETKLAISKPGDEYEREADRVSQELIRAPEPQLQPA